MITLMILLTGSVLAYRRMRRTWIRKFGDSPDWGRVAVCIGSFLLSWLGVLIAVMLDDSTEFPKPPKWM